MRHFHRAENQASLREEYQQLATQELTRSLAPEEAARLDAVASQLSEIEMEAETSRLWEQQTEQMNDLPRELKGTLQAFSDKKETGA